MQTAELFQAITLVKIFVSVAMVVLLSILAEVVSPKFAGVLSGYPLGAAISLFFFGYEISPEFASASAIYTMVGLVATQTFAYAYFRASYWLGDKNKTANIVLSTLASVFCYFVAAAALRPLHPSLAMAVIVPSLSIAIFMVLFRKTPNVRIQKRVSLSWRILLLRSLAAAAFIVIITSTAKLVGARWAGLFSAFPVTMLPLVMIIHLTYDSEHVHTVLKNVPRGIGSIVIYSLAVALLYPTCGIYLGTLLAYVFATLYLLLIHLKTGAPWLRSLCQSKLRANNR